MNSSDFELETNLRYESKFRINDHQYFTIKNGLYPYVKMDTFTQIAPANKYHVRSLYFDTTDYHIYFEKIGGNCDRTKFRIRTYSDVIADRPDIRVEIKLRRADLTEKYGAYIGIEDCQHFLKTRHWLNGEHPVLMEFERQVLLRDLKPKLLVEYSREGYDAVDGEDIRITFDHQVSSAPSQSLFPNTVFWHRHYEQGIVLEIKHKGNLPSWLIRVVKENGLRLVANSKFALGIESSQPDILMPAWSDR